MKILVISNLYPPYYFGGYELGCFRVVEGLRRRGHEVNVLTSSYGASDDRVRGGIYRWLPINIRFRRNRSFKRIVEFFWFDHVGRSRFSKLFDAFAPDVVYIWNMVHLPISLVIKAQLSGTPVYFYLSDRWLSQWEKDGLYRVVGIFKKCGLIQVLKYFFKESVVLLERGVVIDNIHCISHDVAKNLEQSGHAIGRREVIHWGIDEKKFPFRARHEGLPYRLLFIGQLVEHKGVHMIIQALQVLVHRYGLKDLRLSIVGDGNREYIRRLKAMIASFQLEAHVIFKGFFTDEHLPRVYQDHDILIFSSLWEEPLGITLLEGMSSGLAVVGTATGGAKEIIKDEVNGLCYEPLDYNTCARQVSRLLQDPRLYETLREAGRRTIEREFRFEVMLDKIESSITIIS